MCIFVLHTPTYLGTERNALFGDQREETIGQLKRKHRSLFRSTRALSVPVTYLILFVSLIVVISATYSFAILKISARGATIKASVAKGNMLLLDDAIRRVAWTYGTMEQAPIENCEATLRTCPNENRLAINITDGQTVNEQLFNSHVGAIEYELEPSDLSEAGLFLRGDNRPIANQTTSTITQLRFSPDEANQILLSYRPLFDMALMGSEAGKPINLLRLSIINLNSSQQLSIVDQSTLAARSINVTTSAYRFGVSSSTTTIALWSDLNGANDTVLLPISNGAEGAIVECQIVVCNIRAQLVET